MDEQKIRADERERVAKYLEAGKFEYAAAVVRVMSARPAPREPLEELSHRTWMDSNEDALNLIICRVNDLTRSIEALEKR